MENALNLAAWSNIYVILGSSSAGLVGLLFIVTSLHLEKISKNPILRRRANHRTIYLFVLLIEALLVLMPQPVHALSIEIVAVNLFGMGFPMRNVYRYCFEGRKSAHKEDWAIMRAVRYIFGFSLGVAGGVALLRQSVWAMYLVTASSVTMLILVALNAWSLMFTRD